MRDLEPNIYDPKIDDPFVYQTYRLVNRDQKRAAEKEHRKLTKYVEILDWIDRNFKQDLFDEKINSDYMEIYKFYLAKWNQVISEIQRFNPVWWKINEYYFKNQYEPKVEAIHTGSIGYFQQYVKSLHAA